jgi:hypothetical protein
MNNYNSDYLEPGIRKKSNIRKFRDYHDEEFDKEDKKEFYRKKKKLDKKHIRKKKTDHDWPIEYFEEESYQ